MVNVRMFLLLMVFILAGCSNDKNALSTNKTETSLTEQELRVLFRMRERDNRVSEDEITKLLDGIISFLDGESSLKSGFGRKVNSTLALVSDNRPALKSGDLGDIEFPDTLAYVFNFNDSLGFAIISADTRIDNAILAFTDNSSLMDSIDNPGIAIFLELLEDYMLNSIIEAEQQKDSLLESIMEKLGDESDTKSGLFPIISAREISRETVSKVGPLVPVEWGQERPYNNNLGGQCNNTSGRYWAGCVATAVAQILSYWRHPSNINGFSFNWAELNQYTSRPGAYPNAGNQSVFWAPNNVNIQLANLFQQIGSGVSMNYGCGGSGATTSNSVNFLGRQGFRTEGIRGYDYNTVISSLNNRRPLMAAGCSEARTVITRFLGIQISKNTVYDKCHQWVIDGYLRHRVTLELTKSRNDAVLQRVLYHEYLHNNWGWDGFSNGFFEIGVFNSNLIPLHSNSRSDRSKEDYNYQHRIEIVPNIHR